MGRGVRPGSRGVADPHDVIGGRPFAAGRRPRQVGLVLPGEGELPRFGLLELPDVVVAHSGPGGATVSPVDPVVPGIAGSGSAKTEALGPRY